MPSRKYDSQGSSSKVDPNRNFSPAYSVQPTQDQKRQYVADTRTWSRSRDTIPSVEAYQRYKHHESKFNERTEQYINRGDVDQRTCNNLFNRVEHSNRAQWHAAEEYNRSYDGATVKNSNEIQGRMTQYVSNNRMAPEMVNHTRSWMDYPAPVKELPARAYKPMFEMVDSRRR